jgi:hypothetical protein
VGEESETAGRQDARTVAVVVTNRTMTSEIPKLEENMQKTVIVRIEGGVIQDVECPSGVQVVIHDYDIDGSETDLAEDETGDEYIESVWE